MRVEGVRAISAPQAHRILEHAESEGFVHAGSRAWLDARRDEVERAFLAPLKERPERVDTMQCALLLLGHRGNFGWMKVTVSYRDYCQSGRISRADQGLIAFNLAARTPLLSESEDRLA